MKTGMKRIALLCAIVMVLQLFVVPAGAAKAEDGTVSYQLASTVEAGKQYVIVSNGYALTNKTANVSTASGGTSLASTAVTVADGKITSEVTGDMVWDFAEGTSSKAGPYTTGYFITNGNSKYLSRGSSSGTGVAPLYTDKYDASNVASKPHYCYWAFQTMDEASSSMSMFLFSSDPSDYVFFARGAAAGFDAPGTAQSNMDSGLSSYQVKLYQKVVETGPVEPEMPGEYTITAPHAVKLDQVRADAGETVNVTANKLIQSVSAVTADGKPVEMTKTATGYRFVMPASDVTMKTVYTKSSIAALQGQRQQGNPFLPIYDFNPDGEPHIFEDPDHPGKYRLYFLSSHDMDKTHYCSTNHVLYSCPVEDPTDWTYHGEIINSSNTLHNDILYAPDMMCVENPESPTGKYYYYIPCNQSGGRNTMILRSSRPDGKGDPFQVINWTDDSHNRTTGVLTFDPSVFVDDDGKVYGYWGGYNSTCHGAQLDPATNFTTVVPGTQKDDMLGDGLQGSEFGFFEASSMRKIGDTYVFVYSRYGKRSEPEGSNYNQLGYAYSTESPLGPWTFGGIIVDAQGEVLSSGGRTFAGGNTHGSLFKLGDQWYISYHRNVETYARQAMVEPVNITVNEDGSVKIEQAEVTSKGFYINGLNPYAKVSIGTACFMTGSGKIQPLYDHDVETLPVINLRSNSVVGIKYFDFNTEAPAGTSISLNVDLVPKGQDVTLNVWLRPMSDKGVAPFSANCKKIGTYQITANMPQQMTTIEIDTPEVANVDGQWGVFYSFSNASSSSANLVDLYDMQFEFSDHTHVYDKVVTAPTCTEGGYTTGKCTVCGKVSISDHTDPTGHEWDDGVVTIAPTTETPGLMTYTCVHGCGATRTKRIPRVGATCPDSIDFTDPASADRFEVVNPDVTAIREGQGLYLVSTKDAMEPSNDQLSGSAATTPKDLVKIPVEGDWIATMKFKFDQGGSQGWYEFFGFYAMDDYNNLVGIRGGDGTMQDFLRKGGEITREQNSANIGGSGLKAASTHWFRMEKEGDSYTCYWSIDGENFTEMFSFENTGINGDYIVIDAYTGMAAGYNYLVESLEFEENGVVTPPVPQDLAIVTAPASFTGKIGDTATFSVAVNRTDVTYQWMFSNNGGKSWTNSTMAGSDTASVAVVMKAFRVGQMYKVVVTDSEGNSVESAVVSMTTATTGLKIVGNPVDSAVATFSVKAEGEGLTYQWMYSRNDGQSWVKSTLTGSNTPTVSVNAKAFRIGQQYKCVVTDASGYVVESTVATVLG